MPNSLAEYDCDIRSLDSLDDKETHVASIESSTKELTREYKITMPDNSTGIPDLTVTQEFGKSELILSHKGLRNVEIVSNLSAIDFFLKKDGSYELWSTEEGHKVDEIPSTIATPPDASRGSLVDDLRRYFPGPLVSDKQGQEKGRVAAIVQAYKKPSEKNLPAHQELDGLASSRSLKEVDTILLEIHLGFGDKKLSENCYKRWALAVLKIGGDFDDKVREVLIESYQQAQSIEAKRSTSAK